MVVEYIRYKLAATAQQATEGDLTNFEAAYGVAAASLDASPHCIAYELSRCVEDPDRFILRIEWDSIDGHIAGFRRAPEFGPFLAAVRPYINQIEEMQHYAVTAIAASKRSPK